ncbi:MAG: hypothetical protein IT355_11885 [Gemmatimonadaceae bacterium]|nr:hypothetical protein [Gemmatimonadaceae bacterium]
MTRTALAALTLGAVTMLGCARTSVGNGALTAAPARTSGTLREIDQPCNAANAAIAGPVRQIPFDNLAFTVPERWIPQFKSINEIDFDLLRTGEEMHVWKGGSWTFPSVLPMNAASCEVEVGGMPVKVQATLLREAPRLYRVDVAWVPPMGGQFLFMQLITRREDRLRQVRGVIESARQVERAAAR